MDIKIEMDVNIKTGSPCLKDFTEVLESNSSFLI